LDFDGATVRHGLGAPDKVAEAGYYIRDNALPACFRGVGCVAVATSKTGKYPDTAWLRLFFLTAEAADNQRLHAYVENLWREYPGLRIDPSVMQAHQIIYTGRPVFDGCGDPVPRWGRVRMLDGADDYLKLDVPKGARTRQRKRTELPKIICTDIPEHMLEGFARDASLGVEELDTSHRAWLAIRRIFAKLDGCPKGNDGGRYKNLRNSAWELACLVADCELTEEVAPTLKLPKISRT
jgi:hypothetical protein